MIEYGVLGKSDSTIACLLESLFSIHNSDFSASIIKNIDEQAKLPFAIEGITIREYWHHDFDFTMTDNYILGTTNVAAKQRVYEFFNTEYNIDQQNYCNVIPRHAIISQTAQLEHGIVLNYGCVIAPYAKLGNFVTINRNSSIGHHTVLGDFVTINPGVNIAGNCNIGKNTTVGIGANILDGLRVGENCIVGAGSLVTKDLPDNIVAYGVPVKIIRQN